MKLFGLIGNPLTHSFSKKYFDEKFLRENIEDCEYRLFQIEYITDIQNLIALFPDLKGLNVTIPFKEKIIKHLDEIDEEAKKVGAVNVIRIEEKKSKKLLKGYNTDVYGFCNSLIPHLNGSETNALILGTGGASKAVQYSLKKLNINFTLVSRSPYKIENSIFYSDINKEIILNNQIIINTTPLGMFPNVTLYPSIPYEYITKEHILFDLIYNPKETQFLKFGKFKNARIVNGLEMLILQAEKSWEIFNENYIQ